ncbi:MAG: TIGR01244 family sulfur transferase [Hyphomonadaceae bacterium]
MTRFIQVAPGFAVAPQLNEADFAAAAQAGFKEIINNRPDGEAPSEIQGPAAEAAAKAAGLAYRAIPITQPTEAAVIATAEAIGAAQGPILAYCRSGTRSITLWALAQARRQAMPPDQILSAVTAAGYDLNHLQPVLEGLYRG